MNEYITNRNALIGILLALLGISIADVLMRVIVFKEGAMYISNYGEAFVTVILSALLIFFALKEHDRAFYIVCGGWLAYFVLNQIFGLPALFSDLIFTINQPSPFGIVANLVHILSVIAIIGIGGLLVEYLNDGTIYNKAFNILCVSALVMFAFLIILSIVNMVTTGYDFPLIGIFYDMSRTAMLFLFAYFAYDSAKTQLSKTQL